MDAGDTIDFADIVAGSNAKLPWFPTGTVRVSPARSAGVSVRMPPDVLIVAFLAIAIFETALGALRTYVSSNTANGIDVELGARLALNSGLIRPCFAIFTEVVPDHFA